MVGVWCGQVFGVPLDKMTPDVRRKAKVPIPQICLGLKTAARCKDSRSGRLGQTGMSIEGDKPHPPRLAPHIEPHSPHPPWPTRAAGPIPPTCSRVFPLAYALCLPCSSAGSIAYGQAW